MDISVFIAIPILLVGGSEFQTLCLVRVLQSAGFKITVCCYYEYDCTMVSKMESTGAKVMLMGLRRSDGMWHLHKRLRALLKEVCPDIVHIQYIAPGLLPIIAARLAGIKTVFATVHQPGRVHASKAKLLFKAAAKLCTVFFCNSKAVEESWFGDSQIFNSEKIDKKRKHFTIYNGVDVDEIDRIGKEAETERIRGSLNIKNKKVIGVVGRLRSEKGQAVLLKAMVDVINAFPDTVLLVVGDGPDSQHLKAMAVDLGIDNHVLWLGQKNQQEVFELYSVMDVVAVPSIFEGFGFTAAEAMAARVPVVATRVDGLCEVVADRVTGYLVNKEDSRDLALAIIALLSDSGMARRLGQNGNERTREKFSVDRFKELIIMAYGCYS